MSHVICHIVREEYKRWPGLSKWKITGYRYAKLLAGRARHEDIVSFMTGKKYAMSFSTGGLFRPESVRLAALYLELGDWNLVRGKTTLENLLQTRTQSSSARMYREIVARLMTLSERELDFLVQATTKEQGYLLWLAICRRFEFVADFAV
ncbi:MAG: DUF1819 family protein, partial [Rectinemataceae bacterium]|nr:DUF1819 family protein [Rectinemataceae bacterium]